ncbi:MAG: MMPL family transporter [Campylobacterota bacterium]|nr:MMPL family transporter [Campylobacterota bacterium]
MLKKFYRNVVFVYPKTVLLLIFFLISFLGYQAFSLKIDASAETLLLEDDKDLAYSRVVNKRYRSPDFLVIAYTPHTPLLSETTRENIRRLSEKLEKLPQVESVTSILNVPLLQSPPKPVKDLVDNIPTIASNDVNISMAKNEFITNPLYLENLVSADFRSTAIMINLQYDERYYQMLDERNGLRQRAKDGNLTLAQKHQYATIQKTFRDYRDGVRDAQHGNIIKIRSIMQEHRDDAEMFLGGVNMIADDMVTFVKNDLKSYGIIVLLLLITVLWIVFRQLQWVFIPVLILTASLIASIGLLGFFGWEVTVISSNYVSLQLILTTSIIIHLIVRYRELAKNFSRQKQADLVLHAVLSMYKPTFFAVITTIAGFLSLILSGILPVINLGWMMSAGLIISFILTYLLFPTLLILVKRTKPNTQFEREFSVTAVFATIVRRYGTAIFIATLLMIFFSLSGSSKLRVENSFISYFKSSTEIYQGMAMIDRQLGGTTPLDITIDFPDTQEDEADVPAEEEDEFFDDFEAEFKEEEQQDQYWFTSDKMQRIEKVHAYLESLPEVGKVLSFGTMQRVGRTLNEGEDLDNFELALLYNELPEEFAQLIIKPYLSIENDQARFYVRIVDSDPTLRRNALLKKIRTELTEKVGIPAEQVHLSGIMVLYNNMLQSLFSSQILTLGAMVALLFAMFWFIFRSLRIGLVAIIANLVPIGMVFGLMGWLDIPLDMMTITIASISIGIAVDNTIHYLYRFRKEFIITSNYDKAMTRSHASIGYAMSYTSAAITIGFFVLVLSPFIPTIYFGLLTVVAMVMALITDLLLLPKLIVMFKVFGREKIVSVH